MTSMIPEVYVPLTGEEITVDWLQKEVLRNEISQPFRVLKCDTKCITKKDARDGFTSVLYTVDVDVKIEDERFTRTYNLLAKLYPTNEFHQAMVRRPRFFEREIHMYTKLLDQMRNAQKLTKKNDPPLEPLWAKCYYTCTNYSKEISGLILENLTTSGFTIMNKRIGLDFDHLSLALKAFARSHALAYNVKTVFGIEAYLLENIMVLDNIYDLWKGMFDSVFQSTVIDKLRENGKNELADKCQAFKESGGEMGIYAYLSKAFRREHRMRILVHGDCWINNLMFKHEEIDGKKIPVDVRLIDLQISRYSHGCTDLAYFLYTACSTKERERMSDLLRIYYDEFFNILKQVGNPLTEEDYSFEELQKDFDDHRAFGFVFGTFFALNQMGDAADMPSLDDMEEDMVKKMDEFIEEGKKKPMAKPMLDKIIELVNEAIKDGVIC